MTGATDGAWWVAAFALLLGVACDGAAGSDGDEVSLGARGDAQVGGRVISTVNGHPITLDAVERAARRAEVPPRVALRRLQDEALLAQAAAHVGADAHPEVRRAARQAMVQALLAREIEGRITGDAIDPAALDAAFEASLERWEQPARRRTSHVLARVPADAGPEVADAAERWIGDVHDRLAAADDPGAAILALRRRPPEELPFEVTIEEVQPLSRRAAADDAYLRAVFARDGAGLVPEPVRTAFGWHAIAVTEVLPPEETPRREALRILREERLAARRAEALDAWIRELRERHEVTVDRAAVRATIGDRAFWREGGS